MKTIIQHLKGDKAIWASVGVLAIFSFLPVYSASTNLVYVQGSGSTLGHLLKHFMLLISGFAIIYATHKVPYKYFAALSVLMLPIVFLLLIVALASGETIAGANASRWIHIPYVGIGFQPSTLAAVVTMVFTARYLSKIKDKDIEFKESAINFWTPVALILLLILPANLSTAAIIFLMVFTLMFIGNYPLKYLAYVFGIALSIFILFILIIKGISSFDQNSSQQLQGRQASSRIGTWESRLNPKDNYQVEKAKIAIASGIGLGLGPGKSVQKNFLPQSSSDFIYAIIVEETGTIGAIGVVFFYFLLLFRFVITARRANSVFSALLVIGLGLFVVFQAFINMAVAVNLLPVTGQTLPLISSGGTSIWMTCLSIGIILSVSASKEKKEEVIDLDENPLDVLYEAND